MEGMLVRRTESDRTLTVKVSVISMEGMGMKTEVIECKL